MRLSERIRRWRESRGISKAQIARDVGVSAAAVSQWEDGTTTPTVASLDRLVEALGVSLSVFYGPAPKARKAA